MASLKQSDKKKHEKKDLFTNYLFIANIMLNK